MHHRQYQFRLEYLIKSCPPPRLLPGLVDLPFGAYTVCNNLGDNRTAHSILRIFHAATVGLKMCILSLATFHVIDRLDE